MTMRILGGILKGKRLPDHASWVRPTSEYRRQMIFNRLQHAEGFDTFDDVRVIDAFAGTGSLGIEALSRGAKHVTLVEKNFLTFQALRTFVQRTPLANRTTLLQESATKLPPAPESAQLCFLDAPYHKGLIPPALESLKAQGWLANNTLCIAETDKEEELILPNWIIPTEKRKKGRTTVHFWRVFM